MKATKLISVLFLSVIITGCWKGKNQSDNDLVNVDVIANYPEKKLILQDFMDLEYIALETSDKFITQGVVKAIGRNIVIITNRVLDGNIFVFDRVSGKGLSVINHSGQGPEEYAQFTEIILDEDKNEMFVVAYTERKILVYDLYGNFKRSFKFNGDSCYYNYVFNYDDDLLICHKGFTPGIETEQSSHVLVSKQDGRITKEIILPFDKIRTPVIIEEEGSITPGFYLTVPNQEDWVIMRTSSDTIYTYSPNGKTNPIIVRTPSINSMDPEIFLFPTAITDRYYFMRTMKKEIDFTTFKGFPGKDLVYDKHENSFYELTLYNDDFSDMRNVSLGQKPGSAVNKEVATCLSLNAFDLVEAYNAGILKGKLEEIASKLNEEANPVILLIKQKPSIR